MTVLYVLAHFDDEYCAWPLIRTGVAEGADQWFFYMADYRDPADRDRRAAETRAFVAHLGADPAKVVHVGLGQEVWNGGLHRSLEPAFAALTRAAAGIGPLERIVVPAWEGGHMDHDMCALLAAALAAQSGDPPIETFSLYHGLGLAGPLMHGAAPLAANGPAQRLRLSAGDWLAWMAAARFFPSQAWALSGLWPTMFIGYALRGFRVQRLDPGRFAERPHAGSLFYERMFKVPYAEVRAAADRFLGARLALQDHQEAE